jgi:putative redox protein
MSGNWNKIVAEWQGGTGYIGKNDHGGSIKIGAVDGAPGVGPMELMLLGVAGCTAVDIVNILRKKRKHLADLKVEVRGKRAEEHPKIYTEIVIEYQLWGRDLDKKSVERAIDLSEGKYCSASAMLAKSAKITSEYVIFDSEIID